MGSIEKQIKAPSIDNIMSLSLFLGKIFQLDLQTFNEKRSSISLLWLVACFKKFVYTSLVNAIQDMYFFHTNLQLFTLPACEKFWNP